MSGPTVGLTKAWDHGLCLPAVLRALTGQLLMCSHSLRIQGQVRGRTLHPDKVLCCTVIRAQAEV